MLLRSFSQVKCLPGFYNKILQGLILYSRELDWDSNPLDKHGDSIQIQNPEQAPAIVVINIPFPTFGLTASSTTGFASCLVSMGIYFSAISVAHDNPPFPLDFLVNLTPKSVTRIPLLQKSQRT
jgi:hypothetical protein